MKTNLVFVYGTLLSGESNNRLLASSELVGESEVTGFEMWDLGYFPACVKGDAGNPSIKGEVWAVSNDTLSTLDRLEGYPTFYTREKVETSLGDAWIYFMDTSDFGYSARLIKNGSWKERSQLGG